MDAHVYVIRGETGEYSDRTDWTVKAFRTEMAAQDYLAKLVAWDAEHGARWEEFAYEDEPNPSNPFDPHYKRRYDGTTYHIEAVDYGD